MQVFKFKYNRKIPLVFIHIPKCAGTSVRRLFSSWFKGDFYTHYLNENKQELNKNITEERLFDLQGSCVFGHFNMLRNFGISDSYPKTTQFITIMREPYDQFFSEYLYKCNKNTTFIPTEKSFEKYLTQTSPNYLNHFPINVTFDNYRVVIDNKFIFIGIFEDIENSLKRMSDILSKQYIEHSLPKLKIGTEKPVWFEDYRNYFNEKYKLEKVTYDYALDKFKGET